MGEVSEITSIEPHVLRYWETIFNDLTPRKNKAGNRTYREEDISFVLRLKDLIQTKKYSTAGAKKIIEEGAPEDQNQDQQALPIDMQKDLREVNLFLNKLLEKL
ncbi:MerR family transcriptional regulator [Rhodohalobacter sp. SW132]|nr:MerR family transcriptional regulator [Rhodohalobacter sp. SW132]